MKRLWDKFQTDPIFIRQINGWLTIFWILLTPVAVLTGWIYSVGFISVISLVALILGQLSSWQAARVEVHQYEDNDVKDVMEEVKKITES